MDKHFGGVIWTNHALDRLRARGIKQGDAWATWKRPDTTHYAATRNAWIYNRTFERDIIEVVARKREKEWLILSVWSSRAEPTSRKQESRGSFFKNIVKRIFSSFLR